MTTPAEFAHGYIYRWEDGLSSDPRRTHSMDPVDNGNWSTGHTGHGTLIGSNHGVTAAALARHRQVPVAAITVNGMHMLTMGEAVQIALEGFYQAPGLDRLVWNRVTASAMDFGWGAGARSGVRVIQRLSGVQASGRMNQETVTAYQALIDQIGEEEAARRLIVLRGAHYRQVIAHHPSKAKYRRGWTNRTMYYAPGGRWWNSWSMSRAEQTNAANAAQQGAAGAAGGGETPGTAGATEGAGMVGAAGPVGPFF